MKFSLWTEYGALNSKPIFEAFATSLTNAGHTVVYNDNAADVNVIWSVLWNGRMSQNKAVWQQKKTTIVLEVGGIQRGTTWKVGLNGINRDAYFGPNNNNDDRHRLLGLSLKPWKDPGKFVLICGQHDKSLQWQDMPRMSTWVMNTIDEIQKYTDLPIIFRPHPRCPLPDIERQYQNVYRDNPVKIIGSYDDFNLSFKDCHAVISWSSNPGPLAVINGVPVFTGPSSLAYNVANTDLSKIEYPDKPNRKQWLNDYAHTEFTIDEITQGIPLKNLTPML
tara:strand:+ start:6068 stop:6901 length:834 start_codon:yes stop_codon:yes gene_type:complete